MKNKNYYKLVISQIIFFIFILHCIQLPFKVNKRVFDVDKTYFTLNIKSLMAEEIEEAKLIYENLKKKGYIVYYCRASIEQQRLIKVQVGIFDNVSEAEQFGEEFKKQEGFDYFVDTALVNVDEFKDKFKIVTTPTGIWFIDDKSSIELYKFIDQKFSNDDILRGTKPQISPDGKSIVFFYNSQILKLNIEDKSSSVLVERGPHYDISLINSFPQWSPSGQYIAYMDYHEWEMQTSLWLMNLDGSGLKCIIDNKEVKRLNNRVIQNAVKYFLWHPNKDEIFFVEGYGMGTVSVGGNLYSIDLKGNRKEIIIADKEKREEIFWEFKIVGNILIYQIAHFDEQRNYKEFTTHEINLSDIK